MPELESFWGETESVRSDDRAAENRSPNYVANLQH